MVSIEATFTTTTDDLFEEFGTELRGIPRVTIPNAPDIPGQSNPNAGLLLGGNRDARFRTAYTFRDQNNQVENALPASALGGLGLQFAVLGAPRINMLMTALKKTGRGTILDSPRITAINGQRVNVSYTKQRQYIQDGDVMAGATAYEPVINTFTTGVVLDVKPVMSYDRKFVTLNIFPTLIDLVDMRTTTLEFQNQRWFYYPILIDPPPPPEVAAITIEKPWISLQRVRTSAEVPDNGALVLGGFEVVSKQDLTASTPLMDKIPILAAFFRRKVETEEKRKQFIIVRAKIIELDELEQELR
jgi:type II secretory pathway component GspD/PulD (secretin)